MGVGNCRGGQDWGCDSSPLSRIELLWDPIVQVFSGSGSESYWFCQGHYRDRLLANNLVYRSQRMWLYIVPADSEGLSPKSPQLPKLLHHLLVQGVGARYVVLVVDRPLLFPGGRHEKLGVFHCCREVEFLSETTYWIDNFEMAESFVFEFATWSLGGDVLAWKLYLITKDTSSSS